MVTLPRLVLAAPTSGSGKTTITIGLLAALRERGLTVAPAKVGPDYIDPGYHALATGLPGRNLDPWLVGEELIAPLLAHGARGADLAVIEGVMGLFDGRLGTEGFGSTAHVARLVDAPVVLVVDAAHTSRTAAALVHGLATFDPRVRVAGVIVNRCSPRNAAEITAALSVPVLGVIPRSGDVVVASRHLGLIPAAERGGAAEVVAEAARLVTEHVDLDAVLAVAGTAPDLAVEPWRPADHVTPVSGRPRIAVAAGPAFTFRYAETTELLDAAGCECVDFDPLSDPHLPEGTSGLYLGGGFPEMHAERLAANTSLRGDIAAAVAAGLPTVAECAGLLYLGTDIDGVPMTGALPHAARMTPHLTLRYDRAPFGQDSLIVRAHEQVRFHEFHRTELVDRGLSGEQRPESKPLHSHTLTLTVHASYRHIHWAGHPEQAQRFADAAAAFAASGRRWSPLPVATPAPPPDLDHHGDRDHQPGLTDLAVNVLPTPGWLRDRLQAEGADWSAYPDATDARRALAAHHGVPEECVLPTSGAAEAFTLVARGLSPRRPVVVHPQFTEPEAALLRAGASVKRHILAPPFALDPGAVDASTDLVVVGNPTNPTGVLHPRVTLAALRRSDRTLVVDEAFLDFAPDAPSMIGPDLSNLLVVRSLTKLWGLAGLRAGYVVGDPELIAQLAAQQPPWSASALALAAMQACVTPDAQAHAREVAERTAANRDDLVAALTHAGFTTYGAPTTPFVLVDTMPCGPASVREPLADAGWSVRRGESFPGLGPAWIRIAVRDRATNRAFVDALARLRKG